MSWTKNHKRVAMQSQAGPAPAQPTAATLDRRKNVGATPETREKLQHDYLEKLLRDGPENDGVDSYDVEALLEIEEAYHVVGRLTAAKSSSFEVTDHTGFRDDWSPSECRTWDLWIAWATPFYRRTLVTGVKVAELIEARAPVDAGMAGNFRVAAAMWGKVKSDYAKQQEGRRPHGD